MGLFYKEYGDSSAPLIVFLHGGGVSSWMWENQVKYFEQNYHCVTVDLPKHGKNESSGEFSIRETAILCVELIEKIANDRKIVVIGFSLGSQVLMQMMSIRPQLIDYGIINSVAVRPSKWMKSSIAPMVKMSMPLTKYKWFAKLQAKELYITDEQFPLYFDETKQISSNSMINILKENMSFSVPEGFSKANGKILLTVGEKEKGIMKKSVKDILTMNKNCVAVKIPDIGHGLPMSKPKLMNEIIENWINNLPLPDDCVPMDAEG